ncbi:hypothetical protein F511_08836 [Dorcoceras hygrometricum]|uniref:UBN2 domain-containing protein n=1 Tax=Dorcoceras hygrometricum TaxID=472368 RepID=A0A2Z7AP55_9LAMI|nr:hypothetical protein F511_08836 [Dorcoceras hygrometricum]
MFSEIKTCTTAKEIWEKLTQICEGNDETKENKLTVAQQKYESIKMREGETMPEFDERFSAVVIELTSLGKEYSNRELALKVMRALPREWDVKTMAMRESKDLNKLELYDLFANLKAYEFELETRSEAGPLFVKKLKFMRKSYNPFFNYNKSEKISTDINGHDLIILKPGIKEIESELFWVKLHSTQNA